MSTPAPASTDWVPLYQLGLPLQASVPACRVYRTTAQSVAHATNVVLSFDAERFDTDTIHDTVTANTRLTCRTVGKYIVGGHAAFQTNATGVRDSFIQLNGTTRIAEILSPPTTTGYSAQEPVACWDLAVGDYVELVIYQESGVALTVTPEFWMAYIGPGLSTPVWAPKTTTSPIAGGPPAFPADGDIWYATNVDAAGTRWAFQYNGASASAYKWEFVGGSPLIGAQIIALQNASTLNTWLSMSAVQTPGLTRLGEYVFAAAGRVVGPAGGPASLSTSFYATATPTNVFGPSAVFTNAAANYNGSFAIPPFIAANTVAGTTHGIAGQSNVAGSVWSNLGWSIQPVRIS